MKVGLPNLGSPTVLSPYSDHEVACIGPVFMNETNQICKQDRKGEGAYLLIREIEILLLVLGEATVRTHVGNVLNKLPLANRVQATLHALREGLTSLEERDDLNQE
jgi:hypothetical protein